MQAVPAGFLASAEQVGPLPGHKSSRSHSPVAARHTVALDLKTSDGHAALVPVQFSATSQSPAAARHTVELGWNASAGQAALVPVQFSATSQSPAAARHTVPAFPAGCWHVTLAPSH